MKTYVLKQETSNGLEDFVEIEEYNNDTAASMGFGKLLAEARINYGNVKQYLNSRFLATEENMKGNALLVQKTTTKKMAKYIKKMVDKSKDTNTFKHIPFSVKDTYEIEVPALHLDNCRCKTYSDDYGRITSFTIDSILRRPEDPDNPVEGEYVYDIVMHNIEEGYEYIESVDWCHLQVLTSIYMYLISHNA